MINHIIPPEYKEIILNKIPDDYPLLKQNMVAKRGHVAIVNESAYVSGDENTNNKDNKGTNEEWVEKDEKSVPP